MVQFCSELYLKKLLSLMKINHIKDSESFLTLIFKYIMKLVTNIYILRQLFNFLLFGFYSFILIVALFSYIFKS
jgi:hypothetical protein